jgi:hypothetical protein
MKNDDDTGIYVSEKQVYEAVGIREKVDWTGEEWTAEVIECDDDKEAIALAEGFAKQWWSRIKLYRVPFVNTTGTASINLWPEQVKLVADIPKPTVDKAFCTWMDELNREAVRRGLDGDKWPLPDEVAHDLNCWIDDFNCGLSPAQALDKAGKHGIKGSGQQ